MDSQPQTRFKLTSHAEPEADYQCRPNVGADGNRDVDNSKGENVIEVGMGRNSKKNKFTTSSMLQEKISLKFALKSFSVPCKCTYEKHLLHSWQNSKNKKNESFRP